MPCGISCGICCALSRASGVCAGHQACSGVVGVLASPLRTPCRPPAEMEREGAGGSASGIGGRPVPLARRRGRARRCPGVHRDGVNRAPWHPPHRPCTAPAPTGSPAPSWSGRSHAWLPSHATSRSSPAIWQLDSLGRPGEHFDRTPSRPRSRHCRRQRSTDRSLTRSDRDLPVLRAALEETDCLRPNPLPRSPLHLVQAAALRVSPKPQLPTRPTHCQANAPTSRNQVH